MSKDEFLPKHVQISEYYKDQIRSGEILFGDKLPSESEITEKFKVSRHTVRQALMSLENGGFIYKEQGRGAFCCYKEKKDEKKAIAVLTTYISNYIFPSIISGIEEVLSSAGYELALFNTNNNKEKEGEYLNRIINGNFSGIIVEPTKSALTNTNLSIYQELKKKNQPLVMLNAKYEEIDSAFVIMDDVKGGYMLTNYLLQAGHKEIAGIFKFDDMQGVKRLEGYARALKESDIELREEYICKYTTEEEFLPYDFMCSLLRKIIRPTAVVCYNDQIAFSALQASRDMGTSVPGDISVVGYDDSDFATATEVKLTTIVHPKYEMGKRAARYLINIIEKREEKPSYIYKPELIVRNSSASPFFNLYG